MGHERDDVLDGMDDGFAQTVLVTGHDPQARIGAVHVALYGLLNYRLGDVAVLFASTWPRSPTRRAPHRHTPT